MNLKISFKSIKVLGSIICGNIPEGYQQPISPYRTHALLNEFFLEDLNLTAPDSIAAASRGNWTESWLKAFNQKSEIKKIIEASVRPNDYLNTNYKVDDVVTYLNTYLVHDNLVLSPNGQQYALISINGVQLPASNLEKDILSENYIKELSAKCDAKISNSDFDGAITNARTLLEAVLFAIEDRLTGTRSNFQGDLPKQFKSISKLLRFDDERTDLDDRFKDVIRGLVMIVHGLAPLRNKMSDGHARERKPAAHHSRVIVNATKTIAAFLVESYQFQKSKGTMTDHTDKT